MISRHEVTCLVLVVCLNAYVFGRSTQDSPPVITLEKFATNDYVRYANTDSDPKRPNILGCTADNADSVFWKFKATKSDPLNATLPDAFKSSLRENNNRMTIEITDDPSWDREERGRINGYYQCFATNTFGHTAMSPEIRLVFGARFGKEVTTALEANSETGVTPTEGKPYRLPCFRKGFISIVPPDVPGITYQWRIRSYFGSTAFMNDVQLGTRVRVEPKSGDLYFAYLNSSDTGPRERPEYICNPQLRDDPRSAPQANILKLTVAVKTLPTISSVEYPSATNDAGKSVTCVESSTCNVVCMFGGSAAVTGRMEVEPPPGVSATTELRPYGFDIMSATKDNSGDWKCVLKDGATGVQLQEVVIKVTVLAYPRLRTRDKFDNLYVTTGTLVHYNCEVDNIDSSGSQEFYINGQKVTDGNPPYVEYRSNVPKSLKITNVQRNHSSSIMCVAANSAGSMYETISLNVYDAPVGSQFPDVNYIVANASNVQFYFNCSYKLDPKVDPNTVKLYWQANRTAGAKTQITATDPNGVDSIFISQLTNGYIYSTLQVLITQSNEESLRDSEWWCYIEYKLLSVLQFNHTTKPIRIEFRTDPPPIVQPAFAYTYVIIGVILGFIFLVALIVLMHVCVQKNKGEQYYVDEKERKAGHVPEQELEAYAFQDYKRPDQNPIKGSRASMNFSDKPMESDQGSMDEYGDIDTGRFNEDGSFIGQYAPNQTRNQADV